MSETDHSAADDGNLLARRAGVFGVTRRRGAGGGRGASPARPGAGARRRILGGAARRLGQAERVADAAGRRRSRIGTALSHRAMPAQPLPARGWWQSLAFWRGLSRTGAFAAACLAALDPISAMRPERKAADRNLGGGGQPPFRRRHRAVRSGSLGWCPAALLAPTHPACQEIVADRGRGNPRSLGPDRAPAAPVRHHIPADLVAGRVSHADARGIARTARRFADRGADRAGHRRRQGSHEPVTRNAGIRARASSVAHDVAADCRSGGRQRNGANGDEHETLAHHHISAALTA